MNTQTEAQRLADWLERRTNLMLQDRQAAAELRRLEGANAELLEALKEGADWTQEFVSQMRSYTISDKAAESLTRQLAAIAKHGGTQ